MAVYRTGRERDVVVEADWQGPIRVRYACTDTWPSTPNSYVVERESWPSSWSFEGLRVLATYEPLQTFNSWPAPADCSLVYEDLTYPVRQSLTVFRGTAFESSFSADFDVLYDVGDGVESVAEPGGTVLISAVLEEWFEVIDPIEDTDAFGFPDYGGESFAHGVTGRGIRFFERLKAGSDFAVSFGGLAPVGWSGTISEAMADAFGEVGYGLTMAGETFAFGDVATVLGTMAFDGEELGAPYSVENGDHSFSATDGFLLVNSRVVGSGFGSATVTTGPVVAVDFAGALFAGAESFPGSLDLRLQGRAGEADRMVALNPAGSDSWTQEFWLAGATLGGTAMTPGSADTRRAVRGWLDADSLAASGDDPRDWRTMVRGHRWPGMTVAHADETSLDEGGSLDGWSAGGGAVASTLGGVVRADVAGSDGSLSRVFDPAVASEGYRFLRVRFRSLVEGERAVLVGIGGKIWTVSTGEAGSWVERDIDLCLPEMEVFEVDEQESRYPLDEDGEVVDSDFWGVSRIESITFSGLADGESYEIDFLRLVRVERARMSCLSAFGAWRLEQDGAFGEVSPGWWSEVDGRVTDGFDLRRSLGVYNWPTLADLAGFVDGLGGWSASVLPGLSDGYHGPGLEAHFLFGSGAVWDGAAWIRGVDFDVLGPVEVWAQALWDEVSLYPGCGQVFEVGGAYGGATALRVAKHLRGMAWGLLPGGGTADLREVPSGSLRGSGASDSLEFYRTGTPFGLGGRLHRVEAGANVSADFLLQNRMFHRRVLVEEAVSVGSVSLDWTASGMHVRAWVDGSGLVRLGVRDNQVGRAFVDLLLEFGADSVSVRWDTGRERIWLVYGDGGTVYERYSDDLGGSWSLATVLATGGVSWPTLAVHPDGRRFVFWVAEGSVDGVVRDRSGAVLSTVSGARTGVDDVGLAAAVFDLPRGGVRVELLTVESGDLVATLSSDGVVFG